MKVLAISTSPRAGGNTDLLIDEIVRSAAEAGADAEKISLRKLNIHPCIECDTCHQTGECAIKDDMIPLYAKLLDADRIVLATPVYFLGPCAQAKMLIDRCQALWARKYKRGERLLTRAFPDRRLGYLVSTGGTRGQKIFECIQRSLRNVFQVIEVMYAGDLLYRQIDEKGAILQHPTAMQDAYEFGKKICRKDGEAFGEGSGNGARAGGNGMQ
ncbi:MAG TPA: flavodoxin family protein [Hyphomicrobiaceae bacterium]|nr:flavodoxin family protein [Hyphomicrobiaceae bacterium]